MCHGRNKNDNNKGNTTKTLPHFYIQGEQIHMEQSFKYIGINVPLTNVHGMYYKFRL